MSTAAIDPTAAETPDREPRPQSSESLGKTLRKYVKPLASLQLTVALLAFSVGLVFFGTLAQKTQGIWSTIDKYFWSWLVWIDLQPSIEFGKIFLNLPSSMEGPSWLKFPFPGGKLIGGLMFFNLLAAHILRFKLTWKRLGVIVLHSGILTLFVGEFITREFQVEQQMTITEGSSSDFAFDHRHEELAIIDTSDPTKDTVMVVSDRLLKRYAGQDTAFESDALPVSIQVVKWFNNSSLVDAEKPGAANYATTGYGLKMIAEAQAEVSGVDQSQKVDLPSAYIALYKKGTQDRIGTYLVSTLTERPQTVEVDGKKYELYLRFVHYYKPFKLHLDDFTFERYPGTDTPKNYASQIQLDDPEAGPPRPVTIKMNEPLRYRGETFFQSSFTKDEKTTILQVVRNPGWVLPYLACLLVTLGMLIHFGITLKSFLGRTISSVANTANTAVRSPATAWIPALAVIIAAVYAGSAALPRSTGKFDLHAAARLPVLEGGRIKPLDTEARISLRLVSTREYFVDGDKSYPAIQWLFDSAKGTPRDPGEAAGYRVFRIENDQVLSLLKLKPREGLRYTYNEIDPAFEELKRAALKANDKPPALRNLFESKVLELRKHIEFYYELLHGQKPIILPPDGKQDWRKAGWIEEASYGFAIEKMRQAEFPGNPRAFTDEQRKQVQDWLDEFRAEAEKNDPAAAAWQKLLNAYRRGDAESFNTQLADFAKLSEGVVSAGDRRRIEFEVFLNEFAPAYRVIFLYGFGLLLALAGWFTVSFSAPVAEGFRRAAFWTLLLTFGIHTFALFTRMYLMDRPLVFVTNLYSSAVFIGWAAVGICLILERLTPLGLGNAVASGIGLATAIIAHNLAASGDTLEMMQAVLDTNFWLATHVTTVTLGYSATYVASAVGLGYILTGVFTPLLRKPADLAGKPSDLGRVIGTLVYGIVCLATLFSFVGTVLGGIWADQSWGRFWGWDPKENGAVLIVAWNSLILHARWCGLVKERGIAVLAVGGAIITTWSWFGTNQLGVGLHAYGFNNELVLLCDAVWVLSLVAIGLGVIPKQYWASFATQPTAMPEPTASAPKRHGKR